MQNTGTWFPDLWQFSKARKFTTFGHVSDKITISARHKIYRLSSIADLFAFLFKPN